jgi:hypothetical protein
VIKANHPPTQPSQTTTQQYLYQSIKYTSLIVLPMSNALKKAESIRKAVEAYKTDPIFGTRDAATIYEYSHQSICNRLNRKNGPAPNTFISQ